MNNQGKIKFTLDDYEHFVNAQAFITNQICYSEGQTFFEAIRSDEADFTKTEEGKGALEAIITFDK